MKGQIKKLFPTTLILFFIALLPFSLTRAETIKTILQAKQDQGAQTIQGFVTALPGQLGSQYFYIQDETAGIQVYKYDKKFPSVSLGQKVKVSGDVYESRQEFRIKATSIDPSSETKIIQAEEVSGVNEQNEGKLVLIKGLYAGSRSGGFYLEKDGAEIIVSIQTGTGIQKPEMDRDDFIQVVGIASQYDDNYRLLPRFQNDIQILQKARTEEEETVATQTESEDEEEPALIPIKDARAKEKGEDVLIEGVPTVLPETFSSRYFYLQDKTAGIQVYYSKAEWPSFLIGQKLRIVGEISEAFNEKRIKISNSNDISVLEKGSEPEAAIYQTGKINEDSEGRLIKTKGKVTETKGATFYLDDGTGGVKIYVKKEAKIEKPRLKTGQELEITGIVSQYKDVYRVLPRKNEDIIVSADAEDKGNEEDASAGWIGGDKVLGAGAEKKNNHLPIYLCLAGGILLAGAIGYEYYLKKRKTNAGTGLSIGQKIARWRAHLPFWRTRRR